MCRRKKLHTYDSIYSYSCTLLTILAFFFFFFATACCCPLTLWWWWWCVVTVLVISPFRRSNHELRWLASGLCIDRHSFFSKLLFEWIFEVKIILCWSKPVLFLWQIFDSFKMYVQVSPTPFQKEQNRQGIKV